MRLLTGFVIVAMVIGMLPTPTTAQECCLQLVAEFGRGDIFDVAISPTGQQVAAVGEQGVWLYNADGSSVFKPDITNAGEVAYSADGQFLVLLTNDYAGNVVISMWQDDTLIRQIDVLDDAEPTGFDVGQQHVALGNAAGNILVWDITDGRLVRHWAQADGVADLGISDDGQWLITNSTSRLTRAWHLTEDAPRWEQNFGETQYPVAISADGQSGLVAGYVPIMGSITLTQMAIPTGEIIRTNMQYGYEPVAVRLSANGHIMAYATSDHEYLVIIRYASLSSQSEEAGFGFPHAGIFDLSPDGRQAVTAAPSGQLQWWDVETETSRLLSDQHLTILETTINTDGQAVMMIGLGRDPVLWNVSDGTSTSLPLRSRARTVSFVPNWRRFLVSYSQGPIELWYPDPLEHDVKLKAISPEAFYNFQITRDGRWLMVNNFIYSNVWIYRLNNQSLVHNVPVPIRIRASAIRDDGQQVVVGGGEGQVLVIDVATETVIADYSLHQHPIRSLAYSLDGQWVVSRSVPEEPAKVWAASDGTVRYELVGRAFAIHPTTGLLYIADEAGITILDIESGATIDAVSVSDTNAMSFSSDGSHLLTQHSGHVLRVWSVE